MRRPLDDWTLRPWGGEIPDAVSAAAPVPATVPGVVHTDLHAARLIPDPLVDDHERLLGWIGMADWRYETVMPPTPTAHDRVDLVFEGLDTVARILVDDREIGTTANMHRTYRFDVGGLLTAGPNRLAVEFSSAVRHADRASLELGARPHVNHHPFNAIRKMACNFGWDWGPDLVTAGIWRPVWLHAWSTARIATVRPVVSVDGARGTVDVHVDVERAVERAAVERAGRDTPLELRAEIAGVSTVSALARGQRTATLTLQVDDIRRWWPRGHGDQPLYDLVVTLSERGQRALDEWSARIGFRTVQLRTEPDEHGTSFCLLVNDRPVFVRGVNWIPDDVFPHRVTRERCAARLAQAEEAGVNLVRVWGGGTYEADDFYAECDERGLLVWQDFMFACAAYSEDEPLRSEVAAEARDNVVRLMPHPSLALWNGNNENLWGYADWGWQPLLDGRPWGDGYYHGLLPAVVGELDPGRAYCAGSPWSPAGRHGPNDPAHGSMHIWDVWNEVDYTAYRDHAPRFVAEFGWQGPPTWSTLRRAISDDPLTPESPGMQAHQKAIDGNRKLSAGLVPHLREPTDMQDWHWAMSLNQARAVRLGIEHFRSLTPVCAGSVVWQLNDCWPVTSWAAIDGDGRRKPLFYAIRHAYADRLVTIQPRGRDLVVVLVNDADEPWSTPVALTRRRIRDGGEVAGCDLAVDVRARAARTLVIPDEVATADDATGQFIVSQAGAQRSWWFFAEDRDLRLPPAELTVAARRAHGAIRVEVSAATLVRDLALLADKVDADAVVDDMLVTLLPGESATFEVHGGAVADPDTLLAPTVLRSANQLVAPGVPPRRAGPVPRGGR